MYIHIYTHSMRVLYIKNVKINFEYKCDFTSDKVVSYKNQALAMVNNAK